MENYKITKEQILAIEKVGGADVSLYLKETFPEVFKTELEVGKWYVYGRSLLNYQGLNNKDLIQAYGFLEDKSWMETSNCGNDFKEWKESTPEEVKVALKAETIKRYGKDWENTKIKAHADGQPWIASGLNKGCFSCILTLNKVYSKHGVLYSHGKWAKILPQEKTVIPMEKALKIIAKKMKVSPEDIEIKN